jgi:hypothetical protein
MGGYHSQGLGESDGSLYRIRQEPKSTQGT